MLHTVHLLLYVHILKLDSHGSDKALKSKSFFCKSIEKMNKHFNVNKKVKANLRI
jgi:hypothetical protein